eukprot:13827899-Alexandrium_andersonii.AAC.1
MLLTAAISRRMLLNAAYKAAYAYAPVHEAASSLQTIACEGCLQRCVQRCFYSCLDLLSSCSTPLKAAHRCSMMLQDA